jgi:hypothetical protein
MKLRVFVLGKVAHFILDTDALVALMAKSQAIVGSHILPKRFMGQAINPHTYQYVTESCLLNTRMENQFARVTQAAPY